MSRIAPVAGIIAFAALLAGCTGQAAAPTGTPTPTPTTTRLTDVAAGDCYDESTTTAVRLVECAEAHDAEVFASIVLTDAAYPGEAIGDVATTRCTTAFAAFIGLEFEASALGLRYIAPSEATWAQGDREVLCVVYDPDGPTIGSLADAVR